MFIFSERVRALVITGENAMFCTQCGTQVSNATNFCGSCGANIGADAESPAGLAKARTEQASTAVELTKLQPQAAGVATPVSAKPQLDLSSSRRLKMIALGGTLALVVVASGYWGWSNFAAHSA